MDTHATDTDKRRSSSVGTATTHVLEGRNQLELDLESGWLGAGTAGRALGSGLSTIEILEEYLEFVREARSVPASTDLTLRSDDIDVLAAALGLGGDQVRRHLTELVEGSSDAGPADAERS